MTDPWRGKRRRLLVALVPATGSKAIPTQGLPFPLLLRGLAEAQGELGKGWPDGIWLGEVSSSDEAAAGRVGRPVPGALLPRRQAELASCWLGAQHLSSGADAPQLEAGTPEVERSPSPPLLGRVKDKQAV